MVRRFSADPGRPAAMGIGHLRQPGVRGHARGRRGRRRRLAARDGGDPRAGTSSTRMHPGGGLHHAMPAKAWGFCIYNDPALAVSGREPTGLRVLYVDLDIAPRRRRRGDDFAADPGALTLSLHESGRYLFPGTGFIDELGEGAAAGDVGQRAARAVHGRGARGWSPSARCCRRSPPCSGPTSIVSQHGADSHAWDPLAHLRVTTTAMGEAARLVDEVAHRWAGGRWLATGGGGYDAYRVVPRAWALTWLAGAHREAPADDARGLAGAVGGRGGGVRHARDAVDVRGRAERRASGRRRAGGRGGAVARDRWPASARSCCRGSCARRRTAGWWSARSMPGAGRRRRPAPPSADAAPPTDRGARRRRRWRRSTPRRRGSSSPFDAVSATVACWSRPRATGRGSSGRSPGRRWSGVAVGVVAGASSLALGVAPGYRGAGLAVGAPAVARRRPPAGHRHARDGRRRGARLGRAARRRASARRSPGACSRAPGFELRRPSPDLARDDPWAVTRATRRRLIACGRLSASRAPARRTGGCSRSRGRCSRRRAGWGRSAAGCRRRRSPRPRRAP